MEGSSKMKANTKTEKDSKNIDDVKEESKTILSQPLEEKTKPVSKDSCTSSPQNVTEEEDPSDVDIDYMKMIFPDISEQSLRDFYVAHGAVLEDAVEMLFQLEFDGDVKSSEINPPETLGIGDVSESASPKLKNNTAAEASSSSKASANLSGIKHLSLTLVQKCRNREI